MEAAVHVTFHRDAPVIVRYRFEFAGNVKNLFIRQIKEAVMEFIDWVRRVGPAMQYPMVRKVPVYLPNIYRRKYGIPAGQFGWRTFNGHHVMIPRPEGRTDQLRRSLTASFWSRLEPQIIWDTPYASYVVERGRSLAPGTSARWHHLLAPYFSMKLREFLRRHLRVVARHIRIHIEFEPQ